VAERADAVHRRAWAKFQSPGVYATTVTQPGAFRRYLLDQLRPLIAEFGATISVGSSRRSRTPMFWNTRMSCIQDTVKPGELARHFPTPMLSAVGDEVADGLWVVAEGDPLPLPLALFDAVRVDYSPHRLVHCTGTDWRAVQPWILLTNYQRYLDQFVHWAVGELARPRPAEV